LGVELQSIEKAWVRIDGGHAFLSAGSHCSPNREGGQREEEDEREPAEKGFHGLILGTRAFGYEDLIAAISGNGQTVME
jgi:hypothetical protein